MAYAPPHTNPLELRAGTPVAVTASGCPAEAVILRIGAQVVQAPDQLQTRLLSPVQGLPVHISIPEGCSLGIGQVAQADLLTSRIGGLEGPPWSWFVGDS